MKMSEAQKKVQDYRDMLNIGRKNSLKVLAKDFSSCVYLYESTQGRLCAIAYRGRAKKPAFNYRYNSVEKRAENVAEFMKKCVKRKTESKTPERLLEVGDVLRASWGYEQTNIDYFMITKLIGKKSVEVVEIGQHIEQGEISMTGTCAPDTTIIKSKPMNRRATGDGDCLRINESIWAKKMEPIETNELTGIKLYEQDCWTSYA